VYNNPPKILGNPLLNICILSFCHVSWRLSHDVGEQSRVATNQIVNSMLIGAIISLWGTIHFILACPCTIKHLIIRHTQAYIWKSSIKTQTKINDWSKTPQAMSQLKGPSQSLPTQNSFNTQAYCSLRNKKNVPDFQVPALLELASSFDSEFYTASGMSLNLCFHPY